VVTERVSPARLAAVRVLIGLERTSSTMAAAVERERSPLKDRRDYGLLLELVTGVLRWRNELDAIAATHCRRAFGDLEPEIQAILRLAVYQLRHLDRIPPHAVVNDSVELTRRLGQARASGFVNGVLRNLIRRGPEGDGLPARPTDGADTTSALDYLSVTLSHPRWLVARWLERLGFDACERWCRTNNEPPELTARPLGISTADLSAAIRREGIDTERARFVPDTLKLASGSLGRLPAHVRDHLLIQDEGSQLVALLTGARMGELVLDVCAAPGGKTMILADAVGRSGVVVAGDRRPRRVRLLRTLLGRAGTPARLLTLDAEAGLPFGPVFDRVLLDAPCSGLGTLRRDPDIKWRRQPDDLQRLAAAQRRMIVQAGQAVRPGGTLVYATCSSEPEENDAIVAHFLDAAPGFDRVPFEPPAALAAAASVIDDQGYLRTRPDRDGLDAFFAARLVRREAA
jgi:16S rRNA (cytosine967-C5)-methyltransferase